MDMRRLEVFCKVVDLKSFTRAAEALSLSQPTVSEHIRILEETLQEKMIDRLGREALPTPAGKVFYQYARNMIHMRDEAIQALQQFRGGLSGSLTLGASTIPGTYMLPRLIGAFKSEHPTIQIALRIADTGEVIDHVMNGDVEAGVVGSRWSDRRLIMEEICSDELVLAVHPDHPWAARGKIAIDELAGEPFILRERGSGTRMVMKRILEDHGFDVSRIDVVAEMGSTEAVRQGIKSRIGVSILSSQAVVEDIGHGLVAAVEIEGVQFVRPLFLVQRRNRQVSPVCTAFLDYLRDRVSGNG